MKFSELNEAEWPDLQPYMDTCLLPVTGLLGDEPPWEMAERAAQTGTWLVPLEQAFKGRTVTLPAYHYYDGSGESREKLRAMCGKCRSASFRYVILIGGRPGLLDGAEGADLIVQPDEGEELPDPDRIRGAVSGLWRSGGAGAAAGGSGRNG